LEWWKGVTAMAIYALFEIFLSFISQKSITARKLISGKPIIIIQNGKINKENLKKARIELEDLVSLARISGYFSLGDIDYAIMENTGEISFLPIATKRTLNPKDFNFSPQRTGLPTSVIVDGKYMDDDMQRVKLEKTKLQNIMNSRNLKVENVLLATIDENGHIEFFEKTS
jgi:uncharacterized membrane protein YcaP (DUF421 family)